MLYFCIRLKYPNILKIDISDNWAVGSTDTTLHFWNILGERYLSVENAHETVIKRIQLDLQNNHETVIKRIQLDLQNNKLLSVCQTKIKIWDLESSEQSSEIAIEEITSNIAISKNLYFSGIFDGILCKWDSRTLSYFPHKFYKFAMCTSDISISTNFNKNVDLWKATEIIDTLATESVVKSVVISADENYAILGTVDGIIIQEIDKQKFGKQKFQERIGTTNFVSTWGKKVVCATCSNSLHLWSLNGGNDEVKTIATKHLHKKFVL